MQRQIFVLGLGNILLGDEGLGVRALERLQALYDVPEQVQCLDGGVLGLELLVYLEDATDMLIIDAVQSGQAPGTLIRLEGEDIPATFALKMSVHQISFHEVLAMSHLRGTTPPHMVVWGMEPAVLEPGLDLSSAVAAQLDALVQAVAHELQAWGVELRKNEER